MRSRSFRLAAALLAGLAADVLGGAGAAFPADPPGLPAETGALVAGYGFEPVPGVAVDGTGHGHTLSIFTRNGGALRAVVHGAGQALAFPVKCAAKAATPCPHVVLQTPSAPDLNPGAQPLAYGASVLLAKNQTTKGQNVVQKGYSASGSQYKLQVDGLAGRPSCVLVDDLQPTIWLVHGAASVADGTWHAIECRRIGSHLLVLVDGVLSGAGVIPPTLSVDNTGPLSMGGKGASRNNDQFQGALDDVWVRIG